MPLLKSDLDAPNQLPLAIRCLYERLKEDSIYLLENGLCMYLWIGANVDQAHVQNLFGVPNVQQLNVEKVKLWFLKTQIK